MIEVQSIPPRLPDWRVRLRDYLAGIGAQAFRPGRLDCALFAAGAVEAVTGLDLAAPFRGSYRTLADGLTALEATGFPNHVSFVAAHFPEVAPSMAQVGDLAVMPSEGEGEAAALGVVQGAGVYGLLPSGLAVQSRLKIVKAFRV